MRNKEKAFDYLAEEYEKLTPKAPEVDPDLDKIEEMESRIMDKIESMLDEKLHSIPKPEEVKDMSDSKPLDQEIKEGDIEDGNNES